MRGVNYAPYVDINSVSASNAVEANQDGMSFTVELSGELPIPRAGMEVVWGRFDSATGQEITREFAGVLTGVREKVNGSSLSYECSAQSYIRWFDRRLVNGFFQQQRAETTIQQIVNQYCVGFTTNNVSAPPMIIAQYAEYRRPSQMIKQIVDQIGYGWYIDYHKDVHTYKLESFLSPLPNNILDVDRDTTNYGDLELIEDCEKVYNHFTIRGYKKRDKRPFTLRFRGDGVTTQWQLGYRFSSAKGDSLVDVNGVNYEIKRDYIDGMPSQGSEPGVCYVHWTQHTIRFTDPPASGAIIRFTGYPLVSRTMIDQNDDSIRAMREIEQTSASDGVYEWAEIDKSLTQSTEDAVRGKLELLALKYGFPELSGSFTSYLPGWRAGQFFRMTTKRFGGIDADRRFYVRRVSKKWIQPHHGGQKPIEYKIEFADRPYLV